MEERRKCTSIRQLEMIIEFMEKRRDLALGRVKSKEARAETARLWREYGEALNSEGPARTGKEWAKVWNDFKCRVRAKLVARNTNQRATGGGPSNAPTLTALEERVAKIIGKNIGPLPNVRQDHFGSNDDGDGEVVVNVGEDSLQLHHSAPSEISFNDIVLPDVPDEQRAASPPPTISSYVELPQPVSPVPSSAGQAPTPQNSPRSTAERVIRHVRGSRRTNILATRPHVPVTASASTQSARSALDESRLMVLRIEEMRAKAALANAKANSSYAESFKRIAESIDRFSQKYCQTPTSSDMPHRDD